MQCNLCIGTCQGSFAIASSPYGGSRLSWPTCQAVFTSATAAASIGTVLASQPIAVIVYGKEKSKVRH